MLSTATNNFLEHLADGLGLDDHAVPKPGRWFEAGNTIGMLSLRLNLLSVEQIERVMETQQVAPLDDPTEDKGQRFGQIAVKLGYLSQSQVERLLDIQRLNRHLELGQQLVAAGKIDVPTLVGLVNQFLND